MIRTSAVAVTAAAALALGTASATSLGDFDDVTFAASDVNLLDCELDADAVSFDFLLPEVGDLLDDPLTVVDETATSLSTTTALVSGIDIDLSSLPAACLDAGQVLDVVVLGATGVISVLEGVDPADVPALLEIDVTSLGLDVADIHDVRLVLHEA